jgi:hypothetical protein
MREWEALAPKTYRYRCEGEWHVRAKGVPRADYDAFEALKNGDTVTHGPRPRLLKSSLRADGEIWGKNAKRMLHKSFRCDNEWVGGRVRDGYSTRPPNMTEIDNREE